MKLILSHTSFYVLIKGLPLVLVKADLFTLQPD